MLKRQQKKYIYKNRNEICENIFGSKDGCIRLSSPESLAGDHASSELHGEGSFGVPPPSLKPPEGSSRRKHHLLAGAGDKNKERAQSGSAGLVQRCSLWKAFRQQGEEGGNAATPRRSCHPGWDRKGASLSRAAAPHPKAS